MKNNTNIAFIRIVAIFFVILDHTSSWFNFYGGNINWFCLFQSISKCAVPVFFMVTGALLLGKEEPLGTYAKKRVSKIVIPFIAWSLIWQVYQYYAPLQDWQRTLSGTALTNPFHFLRGRTAAHLWFMYALIFVYILIPLIRVIIHNSKKEITIYLTILLLVFSLKNFCESIYGSTEWFGIKSEYIMYSVLGYFLYSTFKKVDLLQYRKLNFIFILIAFFLNNGVCTYILINSYHNNIVIPMTVFMGANCPFVIINAILVFWFLLSIKVPETIEKTIFCFSENTMGVFYMHYMIMFVLTKIDILGFNFFASATPPRILLATFVCYLISNVIIYIIRKIPVIKMIT